MSIIEQNDLLWKDTPTFKRNREVIMFKLETGGFSLSDSLHQVCLLLEHSQFLNQPP
jgi:hypothetical protein